jgi:hypothetical protein
MDIAVVPDAKQMDADQNVVIRYSNLICGQALASMVDFNKIQTDPTACLKRSEMQK